MSEDKIHVIPLSGHWEVEDQAGEPLAREDSLEDAIRDARSLVERAPATRIILHDGDGVTEDISIAPEDRRPSVIPPAEEA